MDPITIATVAALTAVGSGATAGLSEVARAAVTDAYAGLKGLIVGKLGAPEVEALAKVEREPGFPSHQEELTAALKASGAVTDPDILIAAAEVLKALKAAEQGGGVVMQIAKGDRNILVTNGTVTVTNTSAK